MKKPISAVLSLALCTPLLAEPVMYICERPTWGKDEGCGPNKTRYTYAFVIDSEDYSPQAAGNESGSLSRDYVFTEKRGCDLSRAQGEAGRYRATTRDSCSGWAALDAMSNCTPTPCGPRSWGQP